MRAHSKASSRLRYRTKGEFTLRRHPKPVVFSLEATVRYVESLMEQWLNHGLVSTKSALNRWLSQHKNGNVERNAERKVEKPASAEKLGRRLKIVHEEVVE